MKSLCLPKQSNPTKPDSKKQMFQAALIGKKGKKK